MNVFTGIGRLVRDPELRFIPSSGTAVCNFTLAIDKNLSSEKKKQFEGQGKPTADFIKIVAWGKTAELCARYLQKGIKVAINGSIQTGSYEKEGVRHYTTEVNVSNVEFLEWMENDRNENDMPDSRPIDMEEDDDIPF